MATHPLVALRVSTGLSQAAYARLIARTHAELGHGQMAARREKVSRWESGRIAPEFTAQLAIARIHQVDESVVLHLGWPQWLMAATGDHDLLHQPWSPQGAVAVSRLTAAAAGNPGSALIATGPSLTAQIRGAVAALDGKARPPERDGPRITPETLAWAEHRILALERLETGSPVPQHALYLAARTEHRLINDLLTGFGYDRATGTRLLLLSARTSALCTWTSHVAGDEAWTERYNLSAIRAASAAGAPRHTVAYLTQLCYRHLRRGDPRDALSLLQAARAIVPRPTPRLAVKLHARQSVVSARLAEPTAGLRALDQAEHALAAASPRWDPEADPTNGNINEEYLDFSRGHTWLRLGQPARALSCFSGLLGDEASPDRPPSPYDPVQLCPAIEAQLDAGRIDEAAATIRRAIDRTGGFLPGLANRFRRYLTPHAGHPDVRELLDRLAERPTPHGAPGRG
ncbi:hypothetical protein ACFVVX_34610 [Kitasatospora sp. NPDC058170]|uniref:hypothetical protein n=1 Tax=Kitasatospora sp. NPDC058170 TaxID=3346364 RepID=UPI0036DD3983